MAFDGITLHSVINELQILIGGKVNQIHQPNNNNITISIYVKNRTKPVLTVVVKLVALFY